MGENSEIESIFTHFCEIFIQQNVGLIILFTTEIVIFKNITEMNLFYKLTSIYIYLIEIT